MLLILINDYNNNFKSYANYNLGVILFLQIVKYLMD